MSSQPNDEGTGHPAGVGRGLGDRVVEGDLRQRRPQLLEPGRVGRDRAQGGGERRVALAEQVEQHVGRTTNMPAFQR